MVWGYRESTRKIFDLQELERASSRESKK